MTATEVLARLDEAREREHAATQKWVADEMWRAWAAFNEDRMRALIEGRDIPTMSAWAQFKRWCGGSKPKPDRRKLSNDINDL